MTVEHHAPAFVKKRSDELRPILYRPKFLRFTGAGDAKDFFFGQGGQNLACVIHGGLRGLHHRHVPQIFVYAKFFEPFPDVFIIAKFFNGAVVAVTVRNAGKKRNHRRRTGVVHRD